jgi:superfamily II DNA/RNA helicase
MKQNTAGKYSHSLKQMQLTNISVGKKNLKMTIKKVPQFRFNISARRKNKLALRMCDEKQVNRT